MLGSYWDRAARIWKCPKRESNPDNRGLLGIRRWGQNLGLTRQRDYSSREETSVKLLGQHSEGMGGMGPVTGRAVSEFLLSLFWMRKGLECWDLCEVWAPCSPEKLQGHPSHCFHWDLSERLRVFNLELVRMLEYLEGVTWRSTSGSLTANNGHPGMQRSSDSCSQLLLIQD